MSRWTTPRSRGWRRRRTAGSPGSSRPRGVTRRGGRRRTSRGSPRRATSTGARGGRGRCRSPGAAPDGGRGLGELAQLLCAAGGTGDQERIGADYEGDDDPLVTVKRAYDPANLFHFAQSIRL
ncbi:BBE domain-containing protein [Streptomyces sp. NPDC046881]|uniref:BBE domain-containing protein n=1 Tax=Streptomyces sp. NPDC046881 TaxID=3155374 RepID=UPI0033ECF39A